MQSENYKQLNFTEASTLKRFEELTINQFRTKKKIKMVYFYKFSLRPKNYTNKSKVVMLNDHNEPLYSGVCDLVYRCIFFTLGEGNTEKVAMIRSGYSSLILLIRRVPIPDPVPPPRLWAIWKPCRQSQASASLRNTSRTVSTNSAPSV